MRPTMHRSMKSEHVENFQNGETTMCSTEPRRTLMWLFSLINSDLMFEIDVLKYNMNRISIYSLITGVPLSFTYDLRNYRKTILRGAIMCQML